MNHDDRIAMHVKDPFAAPNARLPRVLIGHSEARGALAHLVNRLEARRFTMGVALHGPRGIGKSVLLRLTADDCVKRGWLVVFLTARFGSPLADQFSDAVGVCLRRTGTRLTRAKSNSTMRATGRVPFTGIELQYERSIGSRNSEPVHQATTQLLASQGELGEPILICVDEADLITKDEGDQVLVHLIGTAASEDAPISIVATSVRDQGLMGLSGYASYGPDLIESEQLRCLTPNQSVDLLVQTAGSAGEDWTQIDLGAVVQASAGIPRRLQIAGQRIWREIADGVSPERAVSEAATALNRQRQALLDRLPHHILALYEYIEAEIGDGHGYLPEIVHKCGALAADERWPAFEQLANLGVLQVIGREVTIL
jgi:hypothetical protein